VDDELEVIREKMKDTQDSLAAKIEELETQIRDTVESATETVTSAVDGAKEVVSSVTEGAKEVVDKVTETVENVKESLSVSRYVEQYPWASLGLATAAGFLVAQFLPSRRRTSGDYSEALPPASSGSYRQPSTQASSYQPSSSARPSEPESKTWSAVNDVWSTAVSTVEGLAVGTLMSAVKNLVEQAVPQQWKNELTRMIDEATTKMGGKVMQGNPLEELFGRKENGADTGGSPVHQPTGQGSRT
jgi:ElaB/YqjD/DUF883 family membrane-anchored ribosome-binding protein